MFAAIDAEAVKPCRKLMVIFTVGNRSRRREKMSSLLVIDTPRSCNNCGINRICEHADYNEYDERPSGCPLIVIPEPHGRLIDENNVINAIHKRMEELQENLVFKRKHGDVDLLGVKPYITEIPTIIEAEGKNDFQTENSYRELF